MYQINRAYLNGYLQMVSVTFRQRQLDQLNFGLI